MFSIYQLSSSNAESRKGKQYENSYHDVLPHKKKKFNSNATIFVY